METTSYFEETPFEGRLDDITIPLPDLGVVETELDRVVPEPAPVDQSPRPARVIDDSAASWRCLLYGCGTSNSMVHTKCARCGAPPPTADQVRQAEVHKIIRAGLETRANQILIANEVKAMRARYSWLMGVLAVIVIVVLWQFPDTTRCLTTPHSFRACMHTAAGNSTFMGHPHGTCAKNESEPCGENSEAKPQVDSASNTEEKVCLASTKFVLARSLAFSSCALLPSYCSSPFYPSSCAHLDSLQGKEKTSCIKAIPRHPELQRLPESINDLQQSVPYYVGIENGISDLHAFITQRNESDFFVPVIGATGVGKSSFIRAWNDPNDERIPIGSAGDTSREILVIAYQGGSTRTPPTPRRADVDRVDLLGGAALTSIASMFTAVAGCAILVLDTSVTSAMNVEGVRKFKNETNFHLLIVVNNREAVLEQAQKRFAAIKEQWIRTGLVGEDDVVMVKANVEYGYVDVAPAQAALTNLINTRGRLINDVIINATDVAFNAYLQTEDGRNKLDVETAKLRTWGRYFRNALYYSPGAAMLTLATTVVVACPPALGVAAFYGTAAVATSSVVGGATALGGGLGTLLSLGGLSNAAKNDAVQAATTNVLEMFKKLQKEKQPKETVKQRIFLMDIPGHGGVRL